MRKKLILLFLTILFIPKQVCASGGFGVSPSSINLNPGQSATITITTDNAVGLLNITSSNGGVASVSMASTFIQQPGQSATFTVTANSVGSTTINVIATDNFATMDEEILGGQVRSVTINVTNPPPAPSEKPSTNNNNNNNNQNNKSNNTKIKDISVSGRTPTKNDDNNYTLTVSNGTTKVSINATPEDSKSKIIGTGDHELQVGENKIELTVTSESGSQRKIILNIIRKDGYTLEDLDQILNDNPSKKTDIIIESDTVITKDTLDKIKNKKAIINFNYYNEEKKLMYTWEIDGSKIGSTKDFPTKVKFASDYLEIIEKESNYAKGIYVHLNHNGDVPSGIKLRVYTGDSFKSGEEINVYSYKNEKLYEHKKKQTVQAGYLEFDIKDNIEYFLTKSELNKKEESSSSNVLLYATIIELIIILFLFVILAINKSKQSSPAETPKIIQAVEEPKLEERLIIEEQPKIEVQQKIEEQPRIEEQPFIQPTEEINIEQLNVLNATGEQIIPPQPEIKNLETPKITPTDELNPLDAYLLRDK